MKRRREPEAEEEEEEDTGDSRLVRRKIKPMENNFWTQPLRRQLLEGIIAARERSGPYNNNTETCWSAKCWGTVLQRLRIENRQFEQLDVCDLKEELNMIRARSSIRFHSIDPPLEEWDRLVYDAFKLGALPPPPEPRVHVHRRRSHPGGTPSMNMMSNRTSTNTTNIHAGSCSSGSNIVVDGELVDFLIQYRDDLSSKEFARLTRTGKYGVFSKVCSVLNHDEFVEYLKKYSNS